MSDDEFASPDVSRAHHDPNHTPNSRKGPRFSWTPAYEATFFRSLCESVQLGLKDNHSFKQEAWERAAQALQERHGAYPNKGHLINKSDNARKKFRLWRGLREDPEFLYNPATRIVTASEEAWRAHIEKEPLSRSLRGRPFEHEEFMEILFPDVIGSGGAPKRITKPRRKGPDALPGSEDNDTPGTAILDLLAADTSVAYQPALSQPVHQTRATASQGSGTVAPAATIVSSTQRPTSTAIPPRTSITSTSALTPPEENAPHNRKRFLPSDGTAAPADKRRRTGTNNYIDLTHSSQLANSNNALAGTNRSLVEDGIFALADALKSRAPTPRWPEQAMEIFFRDFADEDMDLQVKIAEKALTDANKAMMFCTMPVTLRKHWVKRLREVHNRIV